MNKLLAGAAVDLVVLDLMMPGDDGLTLCRKIRATSEIPVIMLTAMGEETDRIVGLEMGADDYLAKPFNPRELLARIKSVLRRTDGAHNRAVREAPERLSFLGWTLLPGARELIDPRQHPGATQHGGIFAVDGVRDAPGARAEPGPVARSGTRTRRGPSTVRSTRWSAGCVANSATTPQPADHQDGARRGYLFAPAVEHADAPVA